MAAFVQDMESGTLNLLKQKHLSKAIEHIKKSFIGTPSLR